ncbi:hypothetical protein V0R50_31095 [Pseudomonas sp. 148P]|uniref:Uncharacterized protein n=1 Tax=Pseudomonas ulcerans TaxID=3115852 RepID=A0ABU7I1S0_9PSED|nr:MULTISPECIES: hypothetical protein [unclassified Pseudomonas]MEE1926467.1 hypothetical protein [Pseudomonas sp. 147P]MEE1937691.1 hypothetical protein [Pseudomonas sp. 148P]
MNYYEIPSLSGFYFEDSYVLSIDENSISLVFELEVVLTEEHPQFENPKKGEQYCYRRVFLRFLNVDYLKWLDRRFTTFLDASGETDYGNIDRFVVDNGFYALSGDWGAVIVKGELELSVAD